METTVEVRSDSWFLGALFLVFLTLKLTNVIDWSWWWVTAPLWGGIALVIVILSVVWTIATVVSLSSISIYSQSSSS